MLSLIFLVLLFENNTVKIKVESVKLAFLVELLEVLLNHGEFFVLDARARDLVPCLKNLLFLNLLTDLEH